MAPKAQSSTKSASAKATAASRSALQGVYPNKARRTQTSVSFRRPKTLQLSRAPKYARKSIARAQGLDAGKVILAPLNTESAMKKIEEENTLVFVVHVGSDKRQIQAALKKEYDVNAVRINTLVRPDGSKKAFARLTPDTDALDIAATKLGIV